MGTKERILNAIKQNPSATYAELAKMCNMSQTNAYHHATNLIKDGVIRRVRLSEWVVL